MSFIARRLLTSLALAFIAGFLAFMSVVFQEIRHDQEQIARCEELTWCMWSDRPWEEYGIKETK